MATMPKSQRKWWISRLNHVYISFRHKGANVQNQYVNVARLLDYLEEVEPIPDGFDLAKECDALCFKMRNS